MHEMQQFCVRSILANKHSAKTLLSHLATVRKQIQQEKCFLNVTPHRIIVFWQTDLIHNFH